MGPRILSTLDTITEERARSTQSGEALLVAALAAALVEYRRSVRQGNKNRLPDSASSNWRVVTRVSQLRRQP